MNMCLEEILFIACIAPNRDKLLSNPEILAMCKNVNWGHVCEIADKYGLMGFVSSHATRSECSKLGKGIEILHECSLSNVAKIICLSQQLFEIDSLFKTAKIKGIVFKGASLLGQAYSCRMFRRIGDIDIIIRSKELKYASKILQNAGYQQMWPKTIIGHAIKYIPRKLGVSIDLHLDPVNEIMHGLTSIKTSLLFDHAIIPNKYGLLHLDSSWHSVILGLHSQIYLCEKGKLPLKFVNDVAWLLGRNDYKWKKALEIAKQFKAFDYIGSVFRESEYLTRLNTINDIYEINKRLGGEQISFRHRPWNLNNQSAIKIFNSVKLLPNGVGKVRVIINIIIPNSTLAKYMYRQNAGKVLKHYFYLLWQLFIYLCGLCNALIRLICRSTKFLRVRSAPQSD